MSNQSTAAEPTMEEILASIRRIISEDSGEKEVAVAAPPPLPVAEPEPEPEVEDDFDAVMASFDEPEAEPEPVPVAAAPAPAPLALEDDDIAFSEEDVLELTEALEAEPEYEAEPEIEPEPEPEYVPEPQVVAETVAVQAAHYEPEPEPEFEEEDISFEEPAMTAPVNYQTTAPASPLISTEAAGAASAAFGALASSMMTSSGGRTLEDLVADMLRPMLKSWLDTNLPPLVEQLVREEIERIARRSR
ncbi:MAG: DUF2497 domain-containing protein [Parvibaculaceae bacterium]